VLQAIEEDNKEQSILQVISRNTVLLNIRNENQKREKRALKKSLQTFGTAVIIVGNRATTPVRRVMYVIIAWHGRYAIITWLDSYSDLTSRQQVRAHDVY